MEREKKEEEEIIDREQIEEQRRRSVSKTATYDGKRGKRGKRTKKNEITIPRLHFEFVFHLMAHSFLFH